MARENVTIGTLSFKFTKDAKQLFREMLGRYRNSQDLNEEDSEHLRYLLERHPEAQEKIGCGIKRFCKAPTDQGTSCFWLEREDGSTTDFSYITCVDSKRKSLYQEFAEACREAVREELQKAKKNHFEAHGDSDGKLVCEMSREKIAPYESHLDHKKPMTFQVIVRTFIAANCIDIKSEMLSIAGDAQFVTTFVDKDMEKRFQDYHRGVADLRIIKPRANLSLGGSERITKSKNPVRLKVKNGA
ncbi:MAG: DCL family protein [Pseudomonadota bacterium]|nr:DCL family protein [Gammaproteobacteria bacterium]MDQ3580156.1 DCL family protein [Pseudomonadota bacterium]